MSLFLANIHWCGFRKSRYTPEMSRSLLKWAIKLSQFEILYVPWTSIKGQALADFVAECTGFQEELLKDLVHELLMHVICRIKFKYIYISLFTYTSYFSIAVNKGRTHEDYDQIIIQNNIRLKLKRDFSFNSWKHKMK